MTSKKKPPLLRHSLLTGRIYVLTRYTEDEAGRVVASEKFDVTEQFHEIAREFGGAKC